MIWILWAFMLLTHGAVARWAESARSYAKAAVMGDVLLIVIALVTLDQLQGLGVVNTIRVGVFFAAFGFAGRRLMGSLLKAARG